MIEVHPPHHASQTWRDFFIHIATIVVGLLIAIGLEQTVEYVHHRHIVHVARENIRLEMQRNAQLARENLGFLSTESKSMTSNLAYIMTLRDAPNSLNGKPANMNFEYTWSNFNDAAWRSARDSSALTYMPSDEVQRYADVYEQQSYVTDYSIRTSELQVEAAAPLLVEKDPARLKLDEIQSVIRESAVASIRLHSLHQILEQLDQQYVETLKHEG